MHRRAQSSAAVVVLACLLSWIASATTAIAAPLSVPAGWSQGNEAADAARRDAERWATAWRGEITQLMSTPDDDDFAERLFVLDAAMPLPSAVLTDPTAARQWLQERVRLVTGAETTIPEGALELLPQGTPRVAIVRARVELDDGVALVAVGPTGPQHRALVLRFAAGEDLLYADLFEDALGGLGDLRAPIAPFPRGTVRLVALLAWLGLGIVAAVAWTRRSLPRPGARVAGRQVAAGLIGVTVLVMLVAGASLGAAEVELALADTTPWGFAVELAIGGAAAALVVLGLAELWERRLTPVASAPQQGSFAVSHRRGGSSTSLPAMRLQSDRAAASGSHPRPLPGPPLGPLPGPPPGPPAPSHEDERVRPRLEISLDETNPRASVPGARRPTRPGFEDGPASLTDPSEPSHPALDGPLPPRPGR